nr:CDP-glycerol glycerophosphotransferase family protein [Lachnospiraceae bacterium]
VGLSLWLGFFVPAGVAVYWIASNLLSIVQQLFLNRVYDPEKNIDYNELEKTKKELSELGNVGVAKRTPEEKRREKEDYRRFFRIENKHLVFYSEGSGFYKYFKGFIEYILKNTNIIIHYITSDYNDQIFGIASENPQIRTYYIGEKRLITLMMKMDSDVVVMTMPHLDIYHIKRSYVRKDIEYIFVQHAIEQNNMVMKKGCTDNFDTILCAGPHQKEEEELKGQRYGLRERKLVECGYPLIDEMRREYRENGEKDHDKTMVLIAPSWQKDNIIDLCLEEILDSLKDRDFHVVVRPHPQEVRQKKEYILGLKKKYEETGIEFQTEFSSNETIMNADVLITDWSGISFEYAFTTFKPVLFINTPMKVMNPDYAELDTVPLIIRLRDRIGISIDTDRIDETGNALSELISRKDEFRASIDSLAHEYLYNLDRSSEAGGRYIIEAVREKIMKKNNSQKPEKESQPS